MIEWHLNSANIACYLLGMASKGRMRQVSWWRINNPPSGKSRSKQDYYKKGRDPQWTRIGGETKASKVIKLREKNIHTCIFLNVKGSSAILKKIR